MYPDKAAIISLLEGMIKTVDSVQSFDDYQKQALSTAVFPEEYVILYPALGLNGEAGEVAELVKKMIRDDEGILSEERRTRLVGEAGDVLWYLAVLCANAGISLTDVALNNLLKLSIRQKEGKLHGSGSDR